MIAGHDSRTAQYVAFFRALETQRPAGDRLFADPLASRFLGPRLTGLTMLSRFRGARAVVQWLVDRHTPGTRASAVARTRVIDDALRRAVERGADHVVILGAGYDCRPYRIAGAERLRVFEVDHPATQPLKRRVIADVFGGEPSHVRFVALDLLTDDVGAGLAAAGMQDRPQTFVIVEGVLSYLSRDAVDRILQRMRDVAGEGSELVFTYVHRGVIDGSTQFPNAGAWIDAVTRAGEPFVVGFAPEELPGYLQQRGWRLISDISTPEAIALVGRPVNRIPSFYRIAHAALSES